MVRGWYAPVLSDRHHGMARERSDILLSALTIMGHLVRCKGAATLSLQQLERGRVGQLAGVLPWRGVLPEEDLHLVHLQACCLKLAAGALGGEGARPGRQLCGEVAGMFKACLGLAVKVGCWEEELELPVVAGGMDTVRLCC
jgi:hypothetical protein